jgi:hypothetical protein
MKKIILHKKCLTCGNTLVEHYFTSKSKVRLIDQELMERSNEGYLNKITITKCDICKDIDRNNNNIKNR